MTENERKARTVKAVGAFCMLKNNKKRLYCAIYIKRVGTFCEVV
jgi:hypothetical protein